MGWRAVTIVLAIAIPIIIVAIILFENLEDSNDNSCAKGETCIRFCCDHNITCDLNPHDIKDPNITKNVNHPFKVLQNLDCKIFYNVNATEVNFLEVI